MRSGFGDFLQFILKYLFCSPWREEKKCSILKYYIFFCGAYTRLFVVFRPIREFFTHMETLPLPVKGCKFWHARHSWPLNSGGSLACHNYCDTGNPFIMAIFEDPWHSHLLPSVNQWSCHYLYLRFRYSNTQSSASKATAQANIRHLHTSNACFCTMGNETKIRTIWNPCRNHSWNEQSIVNNREKPFHFDKK